MTAADRVLSDRCAEGRHDRCRGVLGKQRCDCTCRHEHARNAATATAIMWHLRDEPVAVSREMAEMLGVIAPGGDVIEPDDYRVYQLDTLSGMGAKEPSAWRDRGDPPPRGLSTPAGLRDLPPPTPPAPKPAPKPKPPAQGKPRRPAACGTYSGYSRHKRNQEEPCGPCKEALAVYSRERRAAAECGTLGGYRAHVRRHATPCDPCRDARRAYDAQHKKPPKPRSAAPCGTTSGYKRHRKEGTDCCPECREAMKAYSRQQYARKVGKPTPPPDQQPAPRPVRHGTRAGYQAHLRRGEDACPPCLKANAQAQRDHKTRVKNLIRVKDREQLMIELDEWFAAAQRSTSPAVRRAAFQAIAVLQQLRVAMDELARAERAAAHTQEAS